MEFDIASSDTWITGASANCTRNKKCPKSRPVFYPERSKTFDLNPNVTWTMNLGDGNGINGILSTDTIQISQFVIEQQTIAIADSIDRVPENNIDGSVGLGFRELTFHDDPTPIENLISAGSMRSEVGVWLGSVNQGGELIFGGRDRSRYYGDLSYFNVPSDSAYWSIPVESISIVLGQSPKESEKKVYKTDEVKSYTSKSTFKPRVIFDTSTNIILLPPRVAKAVHQYIHNFLFGFYSGYSLIYGKYTVSCDLAKLDTDIWIDFGPSSPRISDVQPSSTTKGHRVAPPFPKSGSNKSPKPIPGEGSESKFVPMLSDQQTGKIEEDDGRQNTRFRISGRDLVREQVPIFGAIGGDCFSAIQASNSDDDDWVFGNVWFMNNYMTLDHRHRQVGIAAAVQG
ncbi:hypothetical protein BGZ76_010326 [Entomortierella beljakovae]|nr:hypothetical protein BGZ76_010326 [Entomortierella beljakovae]